MFDFTAARENMLDSQIRTNDVTDRRIQAAFRKIPRECFVPKAKTAMAYGDANVDLGGGRWMLRPRDFSKMVKCCRHYRYRHCFGYCVRARVFRCDYGTIGGNCCCSRR